VSALVKTYHKTVGWDGALSPRCYALAIELLGLRGVKALPLRGPPAVAPLRQHGQGPSHLDVEPHRTGQTGEGQAMDAHAAAILPTMASRVAGEEGASPGVAVVGPTERRWGMSEAVHGPPAVWRQRLHGASSARLQSGRVGGGVGGSR
jgi:hypothetical protein